MNSLFYVSIRSQRVMSDVEDIVACARSRNRTLGVTGALVVTPFHYAQMLEGTQSALDALIASIKRDDRHTDLRLVDLEPKPRRELVRWSLAYNGDSSYVSNLVAAAINAPDFEQQTSFEAIRALMLMFA